MNELADQLTEREEIEQVFSLTGGELSDESWLPVRDDGATFVVNWWYDGVPEYVESEFDNSNTYRTAVRCEMFGPMPDVLTDSLGTYRRVASYSSSGESELDDGSFVYIGDGWSEIVYQLEEA